MAGPGWTLLTLLGLMTGLSSVWAGRYRSCSEGCCPHEYCTEDICYPATNRCRYGCPDGFCNADGYCEPFTRCQLSIECQTAHACTMNYNLGYPTCQYNLEIGSSLCDTDRRKRSRWTDHLTADDEV